MVLKVPRLTKSTLSVCLRPYSLLGFGDILVPGKQMNRPYSYSQYWTGASLQWRPMRENLFKCK